MFNINVVIEDSSDSQNAACESSTENIYDSVVRLGDHSNYARIKLEQLQV